MTRKGRLYIDDKGTLHVSRATNCQMFLGELADGSGWEVVIQSECGDAVSLGPFETEAKADAAYERLRHQIQRRTQPN